MGLGVGVTVGTRGGSGLGPPVFGGDRCEISPLHSLIFWGGCSVNKCKFRWGSGVTVGTRGGSGLGPPGLGEIGVELPPPPHFGGSRGGLRVNEAGESHSRGCLWV